MPPSGHYKIPQTTAPTGGGRGDGRAEVAARRENAAEKLRNKFKHLNKYPLLKKAAQKIPILGPLLSGAFAVQLLMSDASKEEKDKTKKKREGGRKEP